ncbi:MAG: glycosyltransferase family 2 protein [Candidatus Electrothrix sp. LOE2]|nr:glycosyltransferase family 2 protein [Candidatus Electrothrix sp. LOE2]
MLPKVTIAVLSWNRLHYFRATIESARRCIQYPNLEWIVSDNQSDEPGLAEYISQLDWVHQKIIKCQSHAEAMNEIVEKAQGDFLILWPDDVQFIVAGEWLQDLVELLTNNQDIGSVVLDAQRKITLERHFSPSLKNRYDCFWRDLYLYRQNIRKTRYLTSNKGFKVWTAGYRMSGICGSGIPSLTRTDVWRKLGTWKEHSAGCCNIIDSSMGAEEYMYNRFIDSRLPLTSAFPIIPVAADIITDPLGCKAKVRGKYRFGVYMPPRTTDGMYYTIREFNEFDTSLRNIPYNFSEIVQPIGFQIPRDNNGDRLKFSLNKSVVFDMNRQCEVPYPLVESSNPS